MKELLHRARAALFGAEDSVCLDRARLVTEADRLFADDPPPLKRARTFRHVLLNMTLDLDSNPFFAGNTSSAPRAWVLMPEFGMCVGGQVALEHEELAHHLDDLVPEEIVAYWKADGRSAGGSAGLGHLSLDWEFVVTRGLEDALRRIAGYENDTDPVRGVYRRAMTIACEAVMAWAGRYAQAADRAAAATADPELAACHARVAEACRHVPGRPARNLFEGLQAILLVHLATVLEGQGMSISIGLPDRVLARFSGEVESEPETAVDWISAFLLGIAANSYQGRGTKSQTVTVGGADERGDDCCNALTLAFLRAFDRTPVSDPALFLRWHPGLDEATWDTALRMLSAGRSMPLLVNDQQVVPGLRRAGMNPKDAWEYCIVGCNELAVPGRCCQSALCTGLYFNDLAVLDGAVRQVAGTARSGRDIVEAFAEAFAVSAEEGLARREATNSRLADRMPFPFCSACCRGCVEAGDDLLRAMPYSNVYGVYTRGTSNAVNGLAAIEEEVFRTNRCTLPEYLAGIDAGDEDLLARVQAAPKWGNDDERADRWAVFLGAARDRALRGVAERNGLPPFTVCHVVRSLHHLDGRRIGPTADGRPGGAPVGDSIGAVAGTATEGPTALLNSVLKLDAAQWFPGIYNLNLTLPAGRQAAPPVLRALGEAFFRDGGQELQVSVLDAGRLRAAQQHPDQHGDLVVRVAGLNARFVELSRVEQDELIRRAEQAAA